MARQVEAQHEHEPALGHRKPVDGSPVGDRRGLVVGQDDLERTVVAEGEAGRAVADRVAAARVLGEEHVVAVDRQRPERVDRRQLAGGEGDAVGRAPVERVPLRVDPGDRVHGLCGDVGPPADPGDDAPAAGSRRRTARCADWPTNRVGLAERGRSVDDLLVAGRGALGRARRRRRVRSHRRCRWSRRSGAHRGRRRAPRPGRRARAGRRSSAG